MDVNRLLGDELTYELLIRDLPIANNVAEKRATLREVLRAEKTGERIAPLLVDVDPFFELSTCSGKLSDLEENIANFNVNNKVNEFKRISSRLIHLNLRLNRINCSNLAPQLTQLLEWQQSLVANLERINAISVDSNEQLSQVHFSLMDTPVPLIPEVINSSGRRNETTEEHQENLIEVENNGSIPEIRSEDTKLRSNRELEENRIPSSSSGRVASIRRIFEEERATSDRINVLPQEHTHGHLPSILPTHQTVAPSNIFLQSTTHEINTSFNRFSNLANSSVCTSPLVRGQQFVNDNYNASRHVTFGNTEAGPSSHSTFRVTEPVTLASHQLENLKLTTPSAPLFSSSNINPGVRFYDDFRFQNVDVGRWRLQYDGVSSVNSFLERVEELRISRGVTKERLLRSAPELFTKDALLWFRMGTFTSWDDLVQKLRYAFQPHDYEYALWEEIRRRTQGAQERVINYIAIMENLFKKLASPPSEEQRVELIRRNMLPYIQTGLSLRNLGSINELCSLAKAIESTESRIRQYCPPPTNPKLLIEPDLVYKKPTNSIFANPVQIHASSENVDVAVAEVPIKSNCWNCGDSGHKFRKCSKTKNIFCFKCGLRDVTLKNCSRCSKNMKTPVQ